MNTCTRAHNIEAFRRQLDVNVTGQLAVTQASGSRWSSDAFPHLISFFSALHRRLALSRPRRHSDPKRAERGRRGAMGRDRA